MSDSDVIRPHDFIAGRDGIDRCRACRVARVSSGMVIPRTATCPRLSTVDVEVVFQYQRRVDAFLIENSLLPSPIPSTAT